MPAQHIVACGSCDPLTRWPPLLMRASWTASAALAISISFRTAASGSLNGLCSANFTGFVLGCDVRDMNQGVL